MAYAERMLEQDLRTYSAAQPLPGRVIFDRGIPDILGYLTRPLNLLSVLFLERRIGSWISRRKESPRGSGMRIPSLLRTG